MSEQNRDKTKKKGNAESLLERLAEDIAESMERHMTKDKFIYDYFYAEMMWRFNLHKQVREIGITDNTIKLFGKVRPCIIEDLLFFHNAKGYQYNSRGKELREDEAFLYLSHIFLYTINVSSHENPTSLHNLFIEMCKFSQREGNWKDSKISRKLDQIRLDIPGDRKWFDDFGKAIIKHRKTQSVKISKTASNAREKNGPFWIEVGEYKEEMMEEPSLTDVMKIAPTPLSNDFFNEHNIFSLKCIIKTANDVYGHLKSCGLLPSEWLTEKYKEENLSLDKLEDLTELYREAKKSKSWMQDKEKAFSEAFNQLKNDKKFKAIEEGKNPDKVKIAGFDELKEFQDSNVGQSMLNRVWTNRIISEEEEEIIDKSAIGEDSTKDQITKVGIESGMSLTQKDLFKITLEYMKCIYKDKDFPDKKNLQKKSIEHLNYCEKKSTSTGKDIMDIINLKLVPGLIGNVIRYWISETNKPISPLIISYIDHVWCKQLPVYGTKGLVHVKSFNTKLAKDPERSKMSKSELQEWMREGACRLWDEFLDDNHDDLLQRHKMQHAGNPNLNV